MVESEFYRGLRCDGEKHARLNEIPLLKETQLPQISGKELRGIELRARKAIRIQQERLRTGNVYPKSIQRNALIRSP